MYIDSFAAFITSASDALEFAKRILSMIERLNKQGSCDIRDMLWCSENWVTLAISWLEIVIFPLFKLYERRISFIKVDFPDPDRPTSPTFSFGLIERFRLLNNGLSLEYWKDTFLKQMELSALIKEKLNLSYSTSEIKSMITYSRVEETRVVHISVTAPSAKDAYEICNAILLYANEQIEDVMRVGSVRTIDSATMPSGPSSYNYTK